MVKVATVEIRDRLENFFRRNYKSQLLEAVREGKKSISIEFSVLDKFDPELSEYLLEKPGLFLQECEEAVREIELGTEAPVKITLRVSGVPDTEKIRIRDLRSEHIGKFIKVEGLVRRASEVKPEVELAIFECPDCGERIDIPQTSTVFVFPVSCDCGRKRGFKMVDRKLFDARWLVLEDPFEVTMGEKPGEITVYLKDDLTVPKMQRKTDPGGKLEIVGVLREMPERIAGRRTKKIKIFMEANYVQPTEVEFEDIEISNEDEQSIKEMSKDPNIYKKLVRSLAPSMYGLEEIKESIALQLFGGVPHILPDRTRIRGDIHVLMVGDPAAGKTQLLKLVSKIIPRGRYVSGKGVSAAGLTATVVKDEEMGGWVLEAGALVLSNKGIICIDEFDKIGKEDQINLHEAMSTQTVSIAKATIFTTLPAQTSVIAGANPKLSRFDPYRPIAEQIDIPDTLLSRFDLKFAMRDVPDKDLDEKMVDHVIKTRLDQKEIEPEIKPELFKKYIAYARANCQPQMTRKAAATLKNFYVNLRGKYAGAEPPTVPITLRQYEALIRLAEASAKIRLAEKVEKQDADRAISLMKYSIRQLGMEPETGEIDIDRTEGGVPAAKRSKIRIVMDVIDRLEKELGKNIPMEDVMAALEEEGVPRPDDLIREMKQRGIIFEPRPGYLHKI